MRISDWSSDVCSSDLNEITERVAQVVYTARTPLPEGQRDTFDLAVTLPEEKGETIAFPTIQTCEKGETAWTELAPDGTDGHDLETPAPSIRQTAAQNDEGHGTGYGDATGQRAGRGGVERRWPERGDSG